MFSLFVSDDYLIRGFIKLSVSAKIKRKRLGSDALYAGNIVAVNAL